MSLSKQLGKFTGLETPFYYYDMERLERTLKKVKDASSRYGYHVHYALKANSNDRLLKRIMEYGFGADCVSGNEVKKAVETGFPSSSIVFAGVGKSDAEINYALDHSISCFNCESFQEIEVLDELSRKKGTRAKIALRINPNVNAQTHHYITTGLEENKFGINIWELEKVVELVKKCNNIELTGIHFHIGSQITSLEPFKSLCLRVNELQEWFISHRLFISEINVGGGLGVDYHSPDDESQPDFDTYFKLFADFLELRTGQRLHFELGRALVAHCGSLISRVLYIKNGINTNFVILDAGMTELIRPALYQSYHTIENLSATQRKGKGKAETLRYDVVGPICESSDCFGKAFMLPESHRGDIFAIRTAGAYGEVMASGYNLRERAPSVYSDQITS